MLTDTRMRIDWPTMMIVAFDEPVAGHLARVIDAARFKVIRVPTLAAASDGMLTSMPHVIVIDERAAQSKEHALFADRAAGIGAEVVVLADAADPESVRLHLCRAADRALARRAG